MQNENTIQKKKSYTAPTMEVIEFEHDVLLQEMSNVLHGVDECFPGPCKFDQNIHLNIAMHDTQLVIPDLIGNLLRRSFCTLFNKKEFAAEINAEIAKNVSKSVSDKTREIAKKMKTKNKPVRRSQGFVAY